MPVIQREDQDCGHETASPVGISKYTQLEEGSTERDDDQQLFDPVEERRYSRGFFHRDGTATIVDSPSTKRNPSDSRKKLLDHPISTSLILQLPWVGLALLYFSVFELLTSYLTSMGVYYFVPRYMPSFLTFVLAPLIGAASDRSTAKVGRRNHVLILATIKLVISVMLFGGSKTIFGDHLFFLTLNVVVIVWGTVSMEVALRSRIFDEIPKEFQVHAQACASVWHSVGVASGMLLLGGGSKVVYGDQISEAVLLRTSGTVVGTIVFTVFISIYLKPEKPMQQDHKHPSSIERFLKEIWDVVVSAPREIKLMCLLQLIVWMAWYSFDNQKYKWWAEYVYQGCQQVTVSATVPGACNQDRVSLYMEGLDKARNAFQGISAVEFLSTITFFIIVPTNPSGTLLKRVNLSYMGLGVISLMVSLIVGSHSRTVAFAFFILVGGFYSTIYILPVAMTGIIAKDFMDSQVKFNNNGLYVALLTQFSCCAKFAVENYNTTDISSLGSDNVLVLPMLLFVASTIFTYFYKYEY